MKRIILIAFVILYVFGLSVFVSCKKEKNIIDDNPSPNEQISDFISIKKEGDIEAIISKESVLPEGNSYFIRNLRISVNSDGSFKIEINSYTRLKEAFIGVEKIQGFYQLQLSNSSLNNNEDGYTYVITIAPKEHAPDGQYAFSIILADSGGNISIAREIIMILSGKQFKDSGTNKTPSPIAVEDRYLNIDTNEYVVTRDVMNNDEVDYYNGVPMLGGTINLIGSSDTDCSEKTPYGCKKIIAHGEGTWEVVKNSYGVEEVKFNRNSQLQRDPTPISYTMKDINGNTSNAAKIIVTFDFWFNGDFYPASSTSKDYLNSYLSYGSVIDVDGNRYATVKIGNQTWMAQNLNTSRLNDGTTIFNETDGRKWIERAHWNSPAWSYYRNKISNAPMYGKMYNWFAVNTGKLCPTGWHIPSKEEWEQLINFLGGENFAGPKLRAKGTISSFDGLWNSSIKASNESGFSALPGGTRSGYIEYSVYGFLGLFSDVGVKGTWWSSTNYNSDPFPGKSWFMSLHSNGQTIIHTIDKSEGRNCRCVKN